ncbi:MULTISPECIES: asparagine synthase (glutamine-hydrolyzing) [unclassified Bradyrhizobium]|uniref:asparagine synthase (glutamine-hydrolyzing) n=1 Tax=unclassified Bradyrhizobium TaxID=2631580 RepID=UPI0028E6FB99|nr:MULTISPECIES: asparagine synthase (glutamine-hydrolyzing) [unclassified Bradyrhizobium]
MCGIVAVWSETGIDSERLARATDSIGHRGRDAQGTWTSIHSTCGLGSRRLSLNDLAGGNQPLTDASGSIAAVVNGEFYDFERIRCELTAEGHRLKTRSDSEILLPLYRKSGIRCLEHLRGEFAFALWDERTQSLFAARDRFGIKPLFYAWVGGTLVLASEIKAIFAFGLDPVWDAESFVDHVMLCHGPSRTLFRGVRQLPPGCYLRVVAGKLSMGRYWDLEYRQQGSAEDGKCEEGVERLSAALEAAVRLRMKADVPIGCFLSGGIDSAAVLGIATAAGAKPTAFTVQFEDESYDESILARETAMSNGVPFVAIRMNFDDMIASWQKAVWHAETIGDNARGIARMLQSQAVKAAGFKAVLSGEGADELLGGYFFSRHDFLRSEASLKGADRQDLERSGAATPLAFRSSIAGAACGSIEILDRRIGFTPSWMYGALMHRGRFIQSALDPAFRTDADPTNVLSRVLDDLGEIGHVRGWHPVHRSLYLWSKTMLVNMILVADRLEMSAPVESRVPFLDHHVAEITSHLPVAKLFSNGFEKYPLRLAVRDKVPPAVFERPKQPFTAPHAMRSSPNRMREFMGDIIHGSIFRDMPFFDQNSIRGLFDRFDEVESSRQVIADQTLMLVVHACLLQQSFSPSM